MSSAEFVTGDAEKRLVIEKLFDSHAAHLKRCDSSGDFDQAYYFKHRDRFLKTANMIPLSQYHGSALELGATDFFQVALRHVFKYETVFGTRFSPHIEEKRCQRQSRFGDLIASNLSFSIDLENDIIPIESESIDFALCAEVIEHMDIDPMFMLAEVNRVIRSGGHFLITTPNCCSARNFWKIAHGYRPHFFMQYERNRSPYRHNIEYDVHAVVQLLTAAGFEPIWVETADVFEPPLPESIELLRASRLPMEHRGDGIFALSRKVSGVVDRWPEGIYV